ncbi:MAG: class II fructose-bisphosphate aldolase, partial [Oscillospiraceae bacterium]
MLVTLKEILSDAHKNGYAVGAFNINNMEIIQALVSAAEEENSPIILQTSEGAIKYAGMEYLQAIVAIAAKNTKVPVCLHLDHGTTFDVMMKCMASGWTSIMYDGSHHTLDQNIKETSEIVKI